MGRTKSWRDLIPLPPLVLSLAGCQRLCASLGVVAVVTYALQIGLRIGTAGSLVDDVIHLGCGCHDAKGKAHLAEVVIPHQDPLAQFAPCPVIAAILRADLGYLLPAIEQMNMGRTVTMALGGQLVTGPLAAHLGYPCRHIPPLK